MANNNRNKNTTNNNVTKIITKSDEDFKPKRESAQKLTFAQLQELIQRNVTKNVNKTYTQYTKELVKQYLQNPSSSLSSIIEVSRFLERNSTLYKKMLTYYASAPLFYYNLIQENDLSKSINATKAAKDFYTVAKQVDGINLSKEFFNAIYCTLRDGMFVGYMLQSDEHSFFMPLDIKYCRIWGKCETGEFVVYMDATYFNQGNNSIFVTGDPETGEGVWPEVFVDGYNAYQSDTNARWFRLPPEKVFCMVSGTDDQFDVPLPLLVGILTEIMDIEDLANLINSKTELENYKLLISKIPLIDNSDDVDDFKISLELAQSMQALIDAVVPELVGTALVPFEDIDVINFDNSNRTTDTDELAKSMNNLFNNAGMSQLVVAGGSSSNSVALKFSIMNDLANIFVYVDRIQSWLNYYIKMNISEGYKIKIHKITWYNQEDYQSSMKDILSFGGSMMDYLTSCGQTPYQALQQLNFENALNLKSLMIPLQTSYTANGSTSNIGGRPTEDEVTEEGQKTRDGNKNGNTNVTT